jgi:hypothetical protein
MSLVCTTRRSSLDHISPDEAQVGAVFGTTLPASFHQAHNMYWQAELQRLGYGQGQLSSAGVRAMTDARRACSGSGHVG